MQKHSSSTLEQCDLYKFYFITKQVLNFLKDYGTLRVLVECHRINLAGYPPKNCIQLIKRS